MLSLSHLKQELQTKSKVTMRYLQLLYQEEPIYIYSMLKHFIDRGQVKQTHIVSSCMSSCNKCNPIYTIQFEWVYNQSGKEKLLECFN